MLSTSRELARAARAATAATAFGGVIGVGFFSAMPQRPAIGSPAPLTTVRDVSGAERQLRELSGPRGLVILFWAGWSERSLQELERLSAAAPGLRARGVGVAAVNVEHESMAQTDVPALTARLAALGIALPIVIDDGLKLFKAYGVVTVPSTALVDPKGALAFFASGYSHTGREELFAAIDRLAGIEPPPIDHRPQAAPAAVRRLQLGRAELARGRERAAEAAFAQAASADPAFADPLVELAALALDAGDLARAGEMLDRALALSLDHAAARRERARAQFVAGEAAGAQQALEQLAATGTDPMAVAYLGLLHAGAGRADAAEAAFAQVTRAGWPDPRQRGGTPTSEGVAAAMARYRRIAGFQN